MKGKKLVTLVLCLIQITAPVAISADTLESLNQKETTLQQESQAISLEVQNALEKVNEAYQAVENLKGEISENEALLEETHNQISDTKETIARRKEMVAERLRQLQVNSVGDNKIAYLLESASIQELVTNLYAITMLQSAEKDAIESLDADTKKLQELEQEAKATQATLVSNQESLTAEAQTLDAQVLSLKEQLASNQNALASIAQSKEVELSRIAAEEARAKEEAEKQAAAEKAAAEQEAKEEANKQPETPSKPVERPSTPAPEKPTTPTPTPPTNNNDNSSNSGNKVLYMESTAYSYKEAGSSFFTAMGVDLRVNPRVVAVDPSVIPLGTIVEVEGYGIALAADTGGAIRGNILDVHLDSVEACYAWGRKFNVKVTILD